MWDVRPITEDEIGVFRARLARGFGRDLPKDDEQAEERFHATFDRSRVLAAFDGDELVGTIAAFDLSVTVPGGVDVAMGGTTIITVQPTHRRRGVLRAMMEHHLRDVSEHEEPLAGLWASEGSIYGRFGFAPATYRHVMEMTAGVSFRDQSDGVVRLVDRDEAPKIVVDLYEQLRPKVAGMLARSEAWWTHRVFADVESWREGKSELRYAVHEEGGLPTGYVIYRQKDEWDDFTAKGTISVEEVVALTPAAHAGLWSFLSGIDLFPQVEYWNMPVDDHLADLVTDHRAVRRRLTDALWIRLMDVSAALEARSYEDDGSVVFTVADPVSDGASGTYRLDVREGRAECRAVDVTPDLSMGADVLGHLYLGGGNALSMLAAGRIEGDPGVVTRLHRMFRTDAAPWCPTVF